MTDYKRSQPILGTFITLTVSDPCGRDAAFVQETLTLAFAQARLLSGVFSRHDPNSQLSAVNAALVGEWREVSRAFKTLLDLAIAVWRSSEGAFNPFWPMLRPGADDEVPFTWGESSDLAPDTVHIRKAREFHFDLDGIAKGFIVDGLCSFLAERLPEVNGCVNAGGDLRFIGPAERVTWLRLGARSAPVVRRFAMDRRAVASSAPEATRADAHSSTHYAWGAGIDHSVSAVADSCGLADALTKVGLFAEPATADRCAREWDARILVFNSSGEPVCTFGDR